MAAVPREERDLRRDHRRGSFGTHGRRVVVGVNRYVLEDEEPLTLLLRYNLEAEGYEVEVSARGDEAEIRLRERMPEGAAKAPATSAAPAPPPAPQSNGRESQGGVDMFRLVALRDRLASALDS